MTFVLILLLGTIVMFAVGRPRADAVALIMMTALPFSGVITISEAIAGFSDPNVVLIAALFVIGEGLTRTGAVRKMSDFVLRRAGQSERKLVATLMAMVAVAGSVMSSTGVVAIFVPAVLRMARKAAVHPGRLMMPLSMAALISGMTTLIATPPNLVIHGELIRSGHPGFHFFAFTPFGAVILVLGIAYMSFARRWLVTSPEAKRPTPARPRLIDWVNAYALHGRAARLQVSSASPFAGQRLSDLDLRATSGVNIVAIERPGRFAPTIIEPSAQVEVHAGDVLFIDVRDDNADITAFKERFGLRSLPLTGNFFSDLSQAIGMAEVMLPPTSPLIGETVVSGRFRSRHNLNVIGMKRGRTPVPGSVQGRDLQIGDTLLVTGPWRAIKRLQGDYQDLILLNVPVEFDDVIPAPRRTPIAVGIVALVAALMVTGAMPNVHAALIGCLLFGLFKCIDTRSAYRAIQWPTLVLIVGMLPFAAALQKTGGVDLIVQSMLNALHGAGPTAMLAALFGLTALLGLFISNTATAVLMAPIAVGLAARMDVSPYPFAMAVAIAASAAFMTPVSSPVNALTLGPGRYTFMDFVRIGVPFTLVVWAASVALIPVVLPF